MIACWLVSDLHGSALRARALLDALAADPPGALFVGGDVLAHRGGDGYLREVLVPGMERLRTHLGDRYPQVFLILGNDDPQAIAEPAVRDGADRGLWRYLHDARASYGDYTVLGYNCIPPSPFRLKDWERYDVSRYVDPGCIPPEDGVRTVPGEGGARRFPTIAADLARLGEEVDLTRAVCLFHVPPYRTRLDRAALDGQTVDHAPLDVHIGSIAVRRFMEAQQPWLGLHGHVHESARLTGAWKDRIGRTVLLSAAHDGPELALVRFDLDDPGGAERELL